MLVYGFKHVHINTAEDARSEDGDLLMELENFPTQDVDLDAEGPYIEGDTLLLTQGKTIMLIRQ
jgi:hypothetical protein